MSKKEQKEPESRENVIKRSEKMLNLFQAMRGKPLKDFPVPPFTKWLNGRIIEAKRGDLTLEFDVRPEMANPTGLLHGGMQCAILDEIVGMTSATLGYEGFLLSIDMHVDYLGRVKVGETIIAHASVIREGRNIFHIMAELKNKDGTLVATGDSNLLKTSYQVDYSQLK